MDLTLILMVFWLVAILLVDLWLQLTGRDTYSRRIIQWSKKHPFIVPSVISLAVGFLMGHWFG
jgi:hypothetical protein